MQWQTPYRQTPERVLIRLRGAYWFNAIAADRLLAQLRRFPITAVRDWGPSYRDGRWDSAYLVHVRSTPPAGVPVGNARDFVDSMYRRGLFVLAEPSLLDAERDGALFVHSEARPASESALIRGAYVQSSQRPISPGMAAWMARKVPT